MEQDFFEQPRADSVAFISTNFGSTFMSHVLVGVENASGRILGGQGRLAVYSFYGDEKLKREMLNDILLGRLATAIIMLYARPDIKQAETLARIGVPIILLENRIPGISSVSIDNEKASYEAVKHIISRGKKNIAIMSGVTAGEKNDENLVMQDREKGYKRALAEAGLRFDPEMSGKSRYYSAFEGKAFLESLIKNKKRPDAIFCAAGDVVAMGIIVKARELNIKIPADLAVVGYDDETAAELVVPALTTVRQPIVQMGEEAFKLAIEASRGNIKEPVELILPAELIIREST